jgi:AbrB family looped-hinge helix DNA binding protein
MARYSTLITRKGQVTIPVEIRRSLGLKEGDRVQFIQDEGRIMLEPLGSVVERTAGVFAAYLPERPRTIADTIAEEKAAFERGVAEEVMESLRREAESHRGES